MSKTVGEWRIVLLIILVKLKPSVSVEKRQKTSFKRYFGGSQELMISNWASVMILDFDRILGR